MLLLLLIWLVARIATKAPGLDPSVKIVQAVLTAFALLLAGLWYFVERKGMSHAEVKITADGAHVSPGLLLVQARIEIKNIGYTVLRPKNWDIRLLSVLPTTTPLEEIAKADWDAWPETVADEPAYHDQELRLPTIRMFKGESAREIEPGEFDVKTVDLLVPCTHKIARLTVAMQKPDPRWDRTSIMDRLRGKEPAKLWWKDRALLSFAELCEKPVGSTAKLHG